MSSPLAMRQSALPGPWALHNDGLLSSPYAFGTQKRDYCQFGMPKSNVNLLLHRSARGSSPTSTLAADLSQNWHIDQTPQPATPRRNLFKTALSGVMSRKEGLTTPPIISSSPAPDGDAMDISPLPHNAPLRAIRIDVQSPTPEPTITVGDLSSPWNNRPSEPQFTEPSFFEPIRAIAPQERRKTSLLRPSLAHTKNYSTNTISICSDAKERIRSKGQDGEAAPFTFGTGNTKPGIFNKMESADVAAVALKQAWRPAGSNLSSLGPCRSRPLHQRQQSNSNVSPGAAAVRRTTGALNRPRKHMRRCLSLFEHPDRFVLDQKKEEPSAGQLDLIRDLEEPDTPLLPHFFKEDQSESVPRISQETMLHILDGAYDRIFARRLVIDCRFEYEFNGGHIEDALNFNDKASLAKKLFEETPLGKTLIILHCEYSQFRAPISAKHIREEDRKNNAFQYPRLTYPDVYVLDGGYSAFFAAHRNRCDPPAYIQMSAQDHEHACEQGMGKVRRMKIHRAKTYAFGQHSPLAMDVDMDISMDDSPTCLGRSVSAGTPSLEHTTKYDTFAKRLGLNRHMPSL